MTVKELKEKLNQFDDNLIVMIPDKIKNNKSWFHYSEADYLYLGFNEADGCLFIEDNKCCETCQYYDTDMDDQPCCSCFDGENWERYKDE